MNDLVSLWKNPKYKNIIKLLFWAIFIVFVSCLCIVSNKRQIKNNNYEGSMLNFNYKILNLANKKLSVYYKIEDYIVSGIYDQMLFKGTITYTDGTTYNIRFENGSLIKDNDNDIGDFLLINIDTRFIEPNYLISILNGNNATIIERDKSYLYTINDIKYYLNISDDGSYSVKMIKDNKESIFEYKVI